MWAGKDFYPPGLESKNKQFLSQGSGRSITSALVLICLLHVLSHSSPRGSGGATLWQRDERNCLDKERISSPQPRPLSANWKLQRRCDPKMLLTMENPVSFLMSTLDLPAFVLINLFVCLFPDRVLISRHAFVERCGQNQILLYIILQNTWIPQPSGATGWRSCSISCRSQDASASNSLLDQQHLLDYLLFPFTLQSMFLWPFFCLIQH